MCVCGQTGRLRAKEGCGFAVGPPAWLSVRLCQSARATGLRWSQVPSGFNNSCSLLTALEVGSPRASAGRVVASEDFLLVGRWSPSLSSRGLPLSLCVHVSSCYGDTRSTGPGPFLVAPFYLSHLFEGLVSRSSDMLRYWWPQPSRELLETKLDLGQGLCSFF